MLPAEQQRERARLQTRIEHVKAEIRITDLLTKLGVPLRDTRGKIVCIAPGHLEKTGSMKVYEETDSVFCFGCGFSQDLIGVARHCVSRRGKVLSLEHAVAWLESTFGLTPPPAVKTLTDRLGSRLGRWRAETTAIQAEAPSGIGAEVAAAQVTAGFQQLYHEYPRSRPWLAPMEDCIWDTLEAGADPGVWAVWAQQLLRGYARTTAVRMTDALLTCFAPTEAPGSDIALQAALE